MVQESVSDLCDVHGRLDHSADLYVHHPHPTRTADRTEEWVWTRTDL